MKGFGDFIPILGFHAIGKSSTGYGELDALYVSKKDFEYYIKVLHNEGYRSITFALLEGMLENEDVLSSKFVLITFDDGYKSVLEAAEIMKKYNYVGNVFVISDYIGKKSNGFPWNDKQPYILEMLNEKDINSLLKEGWEIGAHTKSHKLLDGLSFKEAEKEIVEAKKILEKKFKVSINSFAYPRGTYKSGITSDAVIIAAKNYSLAFSAEFGSAKKGLFNYLLNRIIITSFFNKGNFVKTIFQAENKESGFIEEKNFFQMYKIASELKSKKEYSLSLKLFKTLLHLLPTNCQKEAYFRVFFHIGENYFFLNKKKKAKEYFLRTVSGINHKKASKYLTLL